MIFLCGIRSEPSLRLVIEQMQSQGIPHVVFHQRRFAELELEFRLEAGLVPGWLRVGSETYPLEGFSAIYTRLMDYRFLPEMQGVPPDSPARLRCGAVHNALTHWFEVAPVRVLNRIAQVGSNASKPYQAQIIRQHGFSVPETLVTNDPEAARRFIASHRRVIYKSISYVRSIVQTVTEKDMARLGHIRWCPVQFQAYIEGVDMRVHTLGSQVFATRIHSSATDYRYASEEGEREQLEPFELPGELAAQCVELSRALGLELAGIDLKIAPDGQVCCFEVNPSPAFGYYEMHTAQPIARAVARYLARLE